MKKTKTGKLWAIILVVSMCVSMLPGLSLSGFAAEEVYEAGEQMEAEKCLVTEDFDVIRDSSASGKKYVVATGTASGSGRLDDPNAVEPGLKFKFNVTEPGEYQFWTRSQMATGGSDSFWARIDGGSFVQLYGELTNTFTWKIHYGLSLNLTEGEHTLEISFRELNSKFDTVLITKDPKKDIGKEYVEPDPTPTPAPDINIPVEDIKLFEIGSNGSVIIEAEDMTLMEGYAAEIDNEAASGKKAARIISAIRDTTAATYSGSISARIKASAKGNYKIWVRACAKAGSNESIYFATDNNAYGQVLLPITGDESVFEWVQLGTLRANGDGSENMIKFRGRESQGIIDQIAIVHSTSSFVPEGIVKNIPAIDPNKVNPLPEDVYPMPTILPPADHPRVLFRPEDVPVIRENLTKSQNKNAYDKWQSLLAQETDGKLITPPGASVGNYSASTLSIIEAKAFDYAINGNEESGKAAANAILNVADTAYFLPTAKDVYRPLGHTVYVISEVYDWCYDLFTPAQRNKLILAGVDLASQMEVGWPPRGQGPISGHGSEPQIQRDLLAFAIATYNEQPSYYSYIGGRYLSQYVEPRNYWFQSNSHHQGFGYFDTRFSSDLWGYMLIEAMSGVEIIKNMGTPIYYFEYSRLPNGGLWAEGDGTNFMGVGQEPSYARTVGSVVYAATISQDPYIKYAAATQTDGFNSFVYTFTTLTPVQFLIYNDPDLGVRPTSELPTSRYFAEPKGTMIAKTGWEMGIEAPVAAAYMNIGGRWGGNHHHLDAGTFQLYYKGMLAPDLGQYDAYGTLHDYNYDKETIAHNGLLIYDPAEQTSNPSRIRNSGGQTRLNIGEPASMEDWMRDDFITAEVLAHEIGPDPARPDYSYISGDIAPAYTDKVSEVRRSMAFFNNDDADIPALFFVMDKITSKDKTFKKTFILNTVQEPTVEGNTTTIVRNTDGYNGKLVNQTLYPTDATIEPIGGPGKQWWIFDQNYPPSGVDDQTYNASWGRIEISPSVESETDYFLNAMYMTDADKVVEAKAELIENDVILGAKLDDTVAIFVKNKERATSNISFDVTGDGEKRIFIAGIKEGGWSITKDGATFGDQIATEDGGVIYFKGEAGKYTISYTDSSAKREEVAVALEEHEGIMIKVDSKYMYTDVPPTIVDDRTLVPLRAIFEKLDAEIIWDEATSTVTGIKDDLTVKLTIGDTRAYVNDREITLDVPAMLISDRTMVPVRFVSESLGAKVTWDELSRTVYIESDLDFKPLAPNGVKIVACEWSSDNGESQNGYKAYDQDEATRWAAEGVGEWIIFELVDEVEIASYYTHFLNPDRIYWYDLYASVDGVNYELILSTQTKGEGEKEERTLETPVRAKYIKMVGKANSQNAWNSLHEIEFRTK